MRMFEENYSYCVIAKKLSHAKGWVSKWIRRWKTNPVKSLQSQSRWQLTNKTALNLTAQRIVRNSKYQTCTSHREIGLQIRQICLRLKTFGALWLQLFMPAQSHRHWRHSNVVFKKSRRSICFTTLQNLIGLMPE